MSVQFERSVSDLMATRIRHCVECPECLTRYLLASSPYGNRSYLVPKVIGSSEEFTLYCWCKRPAVVSRWKWSEVKSCEIARTAYDRGYGTAEEIVELNYQPRKAWSFDISRYLDLKSTEKERNWRQS